jgi:hypothetical protein
LTPGAIASSAWRVGFSLHSSSRQPRPRSQPPSRHLGAGDAIERLGERAAAEQPQLAPRERPAREVHVRVDEAGHDAGAVEVDAPRAGRRVGRVVEHRGDPLALDDDRRGERALRVQRPHAAPSRTLGSRAVPGSTVCLTFDFDALSVWFGYQHVTPAMLQRGEYGARVGVPGCWRSWRRGSCRDVLHPGPHDRVVPAPCEAILAAGHEVAHHS